MNQTATQIACLIIAGYFAAETQWSLSISFAVLALANWIDGKTKKSPPTP